MSPAGAGRGAVWAVIPARYQSARFPGKPLVQLAGKPMIQHVYERTAATPSVDRVLVATDDARIREAVEKFGGEAVMTGDLPTGTDRVAAAIAQLSGRGATPGWVLNVQGDEPLIDPEDLERLVSGLRETADGVMGTLVFAIKPDDRGDENQGKVVLDLNGRALYFSRAAIPFLRNPGYRGWRTMGIYLFRADFLQTFAGLPQTPLAEAEQLEQIRALEHGYPIHCFEAHSDSVDVDLPEDLAQVEAMMKAGSAG